ncbi:DUF1707 domain-containing protein [Streptosporangiaceae bacterium NEAU-GS5]|nr:DUF1707 domain-containing protein [Streptosporangiaceae bacterium NEAU-GS5]
MTDPDDLRIGDRERDAVTEALHDAFAQGRIDRAELDERLTATLSAKTTADLRRVTADLPASETVAEWERAERERRIDQARRLGEDYGRQVAGPHTHRGPFNTPGIGPFNGPFRGPGNGFMGPPWAAGMSRTGRGRHPNRFGPRRRGGPPFPIVLLLILAIAALITGAAWPLFFALKIFFFFWLIGTIVTLTRFRRPR